MIFKNDRTNYILLYTKNISQHITKQIFGARKMIVIYHETYRWEKKSIVHNKLYQNIKYTMCIVHV